MSLLVQWGVISVTAGKWRELASELDIEPSVYNAIGNVLYRDDSVAACREMFSWWLSGDGSACTWEELIKSLKRMNFHELAQQLEVRLCH